MRHLLLLVAVCTPLPALAQPSIFDYRVNVGRVYAANCLDPEASKDASSVIKENTLLEEEQPSVADSSASPHDDCKAGKSRLYLMWDHIKAPGKQLVPAGTVVTRQATGLVGGTSTMLTYEERLDEPLLAPGEGTRAPVVPSGPTGSATVYPDAKDPSILHINFLLTPSGVSWGQGSEQITLTGEQLRDVDYYFKLRNRESITFNYSAWNIGAVTVPFKLRVGQDDAGSDVSTDAGLGLFVGHRWGYVNYLYHEHAAKTIESTRSITAGVFLGLSAMSLDSTNAVLRDFTRTEQGEIVPSPGNSIPLVEKKNVAVSSIGFGVMGSVRGVEAGLFAGLDLAFTQNAEWSTTYVGILFHGSVSGLVSSF